ncbi:hypothetical protein [Kitasatospora sp. NPDC057223]|uniref:hypothetical protein n=1 Tax=Kitasatospora sp. NPDC057223 TaxID=3346055 RepID=UPI0036390EF6
MPFEDEFPLALRNAAELAPDPATVVLAAGAVRRARRRRTRGVLAGVAAVLAVATAGALLLPGSGSGRALGPSGGRATAGGVSGPEMVALLTALLPPGGISDAGGTGTSDAGGPGARPGAHLTFDDGRGAAMISLIIQRVAGPDAAQCMDSFDTPTESCERTWLPDGSAVVIDRMNARTAGRPKEWRAVYATPGGKQVLLSSYNAVTGGPPLTRPDPPLSAEQLTAVVTSPSWDAVFAALPAASASDVSPVPSPGATPTVAPLPDPAEILATATPLLPPGAVAGPPQTQESAGRAHLQVTFEGRTSMLLVSVQPASEENRRAKELLEQGAEPDLTRLPDGSGVSVRDSSATRGGGGSQTQWSVEAFHPDGRRIQVSEWNGLTGYEFNPGTPALTVEQLTAIAAGRSWRS